MKLNNKRKHTFNGGAKILKNKTQIAPLTEVSMKHLQNKKSLPKSEEQNQAIELTVVLICGQRITYK